MSDPEQEWVLYSVLVQTDKRWSRRSFSGAGGRAAGAGARARIFAEQTRAREDVVAVFFTRWDRIKFRWVDVDG
jgi:hypothetical protein